jgi:2-polyprenyl-3-methyl-5-hydroxy-6-metoxy-1,4-benzoquinol methylase
MTLMSDLAEDLTRRLLIDAGVREGLRVLDIGCGRGDVTFLARQLVGERGQVLGIDRDDAPFEAARARARDFGFANVSFTRVDLGALTSELGLFDAVVARRVIMYQPDAVACLKRLADVLGPGGLIVLQEHDSTSMPICLPAMPLHEQVHGWLWKTVAHEGADVHMGLHLGPALEQTGFTVERVRAEATVLTPDQPHTIGTIVRAMVGRIVGAGVATADELDADTLDERLAAERREANGTCIWEMVFGAWARKTA